LLVGLILLLWEGLGMKVILTDFSEQPAYTVGGLERIMASLANNLTNNANNANEVVRFVVK
jgi:hypothetical protein